MTDKKIETCIADYCARTISHGDLAYLRDWLDADPNNKEVFAGSLKVYKQSREAALCGHIDSSEAWRDIIMRLRRHRRRPWLVAAAAAVILLVCMPLFMEDRDHVGAPGRSIAVLQLGDGRNITLGDATGMPSVDGMFVPSSEPGTIVYAETDGEPVFHTINVPTGGEYSVVLADGTRVHLNSRTRLRYPTHFTGPDREVWMEGEAYFDVTPDTLRRFVVRTADAEIEVLGTSFNVTAYPEDGATVTTLVSGKVSVAAGNGAREEIAPGQQATANSGGVVVRDVETGNYTAWTGGAYEFENMPLAEICTRLSRWYDVEFEFADAELAGRRFTGGTWRYVPLDDFLRTIEKSTDISFRIHGNHTVVVNKKIPSKT